MSQISLNYFFQDTSRPDEVVMDLSAFDIGEAIEIAESSMDEWGDQPFAFQFVNRYLKENGRYSHQFSPTYYLGGRVRTIQEIQSADKPDERELLRKMALCRCDKVITTVTPCPVTLPFARDGVVLEWEAPTFHLVTASPKF